MKVKFRGKVFDFPDNTTLRDRQAWRADIVWHLGCIPKLLGEAVYNLSLALSHCSLLLQVYSKLLWRYLCQTLGARL